MSLCSAAANVVLKGRDEKFIKNNFSALIDQMQAEIYNQYLKAQNRAGQAAIDSRIKTQGTVPFEELDKFFMSIFQSRKSRAGKAFEYIIKELFTNLSYPFAEQVDVDGAKPDFLMPSEEYYRTRPLDSIIFTAKRTLRERWRQVVTEANKGYGFFLGTIDEKVTKSQIDQAATHKIYLVVPESIKMKNPVYKEAYSVLTFEQFFNDFLDPAVKRWRQSGAL